LRVVLAEDRVSADTSSPLGPLPSWNSGGQLVDIADREVLYRVMEGE